MLPISSSSGCQTGPVSEERQAVGFQFFLKLADVVERAFGHDGEQAGIARQHLLPELLQGTIHALELFERLVELCVVRDHPTFPYRCYGRRRRIPLRRSSRPRTCWK